MNSDEQVDQSPTQTQTNVTIANNLIAHSVSTEPNSIKDDSTSILHPKYWLPGLIAGSVFLYLLKFIAAVSGGILSLAVIGSATAAHVAAIKKTDSDTLSNKDKHLSVIILFCGLLISWLVYYFLLSGYKPKTARKLLFIGLQVAAIDAIAVVTGIFTLTVIMGIAGSRL